MNKDGARARANLCYDWDTQLPIVNGIHNQVKLSENSSCGYSGSRSTDTKYFDFILTLNCGNKSLTSTTAT